MIRSFAAATAALFLIASSAQAAPAPDGVYATPGGKAQVRIAACGPAVCATLVGLRKPNDKQGRPKTDKHNPDPGKRSRPVIGLSLLSGMAPDGPGWSGRFYNPDDGATYAGSLRSGPNDTLRLKGCVLGGLICKTQVLTRVG